MRQIDNPNFNSLLHCAHAGFLIINNVTNLNSKISADFFLYDLLKNTVIIQRNKTRHMINWLELEQFAYQTGYDFIIFIAHYFYNRKNRNKLIIYCNFVKIPDGKHGAISLGLLYYYKRIFVIILVNFYTL